MDYKTFEAKLLHEIKEGMFKEKTRLPPESALATQFGVSRTMIRDGLALLEREGFISRRQGVGTIINKHVLAVKTRMDLELEFLDMIREAGAEPSLIIEDISIIFCDDILACKLETKAQTPVLKIVRIVSGNGVPSIFCTDYISFQIISDYSYSREDLEKPVFYFLEHFCNTDVYMDLSVVEAVLADDYLAERLKVEKGAPLLKVDERGFDINGKCVLYSDEYYAGNILQHTILRKKIGG